VTKLDPFTRKRIERFIEKHRSSSGQLPSFQDFERGGFDRELIKVAERQGFIEEFYVTLTNGTIIKGYKVRSDT
jgi:hypothetical protein